MIISATPLYALLPSFIAIFLILLSSSRPNLREFWTLAAAVIKFLIVLSMVPPILAGNVIQFTLIEVFPGLPLAFRVDALGIFFALVASFLWIITSVYSIGYVRNAGEKKQTRYFACFALSLSATLGVAFSANLLTAFVFYEIITFSTFPLVAHKETPEALAGARKYLTYLLGTSILFQLAAIVATWAFAGTLDFSARGILAGKAPDVVLVVIFVLYVAGIAKAGMMPFHGWLPSAMVAPTPVSALLHAVAVVKTGVFLMTRVVLNVFGVDLMSELGIAFAFTCFASFTIIVASCMALRQDNLKARLAYSTVSQLSYIMLGASLLSVSGMTGGIIHIVMHAFGKITLFFTAGAIYIASHKTLVSQLNGIGRRMPLTMAAFTIGSLSMIGLPPFGGFWSKWFLALGAVESGHLVVLLVLAGSTLLNASYFLPIVFVAFFKKEDPSGDAHSEHGEAPMMMVVPLLLTAIGTTFLFFRPAPFLKLAEQMVRLATGGA